MTWDAGIGCFKQRLYLSGCEMRTNVFWIPVFAGMTAQKSFYDTIIFNLQKKTSMTIVSKN